MSRSIRAPPGLFDRPQLGFAQVSVVATPNGDAVHISGQVAWDTDQKIVGADEIGCQLEKSLENFPLRWDGWRRLGPTILVRSSTLIISAMRRHAGRCDGTATLSAKGPALPALLVMVGQLVVSNGDRCEPLDLHDQSLTSSVVRVFY
jgi:hypothetical protein